MNELEKKVDELTLRLEKLENETYPLTKKISIREIGEAMIMGMKKAAKIVANTETTYEDLNHVPEDNR